MYFLKKYGGGKCHAKGCSGRQQANEPESSTRAKSDAHACRSALKNTDLTDFVLQPALREAEAIIEAADHLKLSKRDSLLVLELLENPPAANAKLRAATMALPPPA